MIRYTIDGAIPLPPGGTLIDIRLEFDEYNCVDLKVNNITVAYFDPDGRFSDLPITDRELDSLKKAGLQFTAEGTLF